MPAPLSIIIPALNAADQLPLCLAALMPGVEAGLIREVVLVDGGSSDTTKAIADEAGAVMIDSAPGRGLQLKTGAEAARGDWLLFLHADTALAPDWTEAVLRHMEQSPDKAAAFTLAFRSDAHMAKRVARRANWRARTFGLAYGDQGLLISRALYEAVGGYEPVPLMEDVKIARKLGKARLTLLSAEARTSADKYERDGWRKRSLSNLWTLTRYYCGASPDKLAERYR